MAKFPLLSKVVDLQYQQYTCYYKLAHCQWGFKPDSHLHKLSEIKHFQQECTCTYIYAQTRHQPSFGRDPSINGGGDVEQTDRQMDKRKNSNYSMIKGYHPL